MKKGNNSSACRFTVAIALWACSTLNVISGIIYMVQGDERWWSRCALATIIFGLWYAGSKN